MDSENGTRMNADERGFSKEYVDKFNDFFGIGWIRNLPKLVVMKSECEANNIFEKQFERKREGWQIGWICDADKVCVLRRELCYGDQREESYSKLIGHELAHSFTFAYCEKRGFNCGKLPKWIWEGIAIYLSGHPRQDNKFSRFLDSYDSYCDGLYQESGFVISLLVKRFGKEKFLRLVDGCSKVENKDDFRELFKEIYGFKLSYQKLNKLIIENED